MDSAQPDARDLTAPYNQLRRLAHQWLSGDADPLVRVKGATLVARTLLVVGEEELALRLLREMREQMLPETPAHRHFYIVLANEAYCHIAIGDRAYDHDRDAARHRYVEALKLLERIKRIQRRRERIKDDERAYQSWHAVDLAYAHYRLGNLNACEEALRDAASFGPDMEELGDWYKQLHNIGDFPQRIDAAIQWAREAFEGDEAPEGESSTSAS